jgi:hypothetical protein
VIPTEALGQDGPGDVTAGTQGRDQALAIELGRLGLATPLCGETFHGSQTSGLGQNSPWDLWVVESHTEGISMISRRKSVK